ncbi:MAG: hypothetical protein ACD_11C00116G0004 [uncultured bacterium]|nr:MAG: hypothetical protein ACD_11C00116G0004 [uncultured bacterium]HBR71252.1 hypothetical protein [Candidatus Moranbacteria bacterium]
MKLSLNKTIEYIFYLLIFLLPWQTIFILREPFIGRNKWEYGMIGLYGIDALILFLLVLSLIKYIKNGNFKSIFNNSILNLKNPKHFLPSAFCLLLFWSFLSIVWSSDKTLAFYFSLKLFLAIGLFWSVARINFNWKKLIFVLLLAGALQGALAVGQFLTQQDFSSALLGTSRHIASVGGSSVIELPKERWLRAYGSFSHPNILGGYLAIILLLIIAKKQESAGEQQETNLLRNYITNYGLLVTGYAITFSGLIVSFSRSAWIIFAFGFILLFIFQKEKKIALTKLAIVFGIVGFVWMSAFSPLFFSRAKGQARLEQKSFSDRSEYVLQSKEIIKENFWLGVGAGNYTSAVFEKNPHKQIWQIQPVHNIFLLVWSELGIVGLILFLGVLFFSAQTAFRLGWTSGLLLSTFYFLLFIDHWLWTSHFGIIFFFLILSLVAKKENYSNMLNT